MAAPPVAATSKLVFGLVALVTIGAMRSVHLLTIPSRRRAIEMISRFHHPIWTKFASTVFLAIGVGLLWIGFPIIAAALIFYGAGIESIARGTLPLAVFGEARYASFMGRIAMPSVIMQAASPSLGALLIDTFGADSALAALLAAALVNVVQVSALYLILLRRGSLQLP